jgi:hypothetical protein
MMRHLCSRQLSAAHATAALSSLPSTIGDAFRQMATTTRILSTPFIHNKQLASGSLLSFRFISLRCA